MTFFMKHVFTIVGNTPLCLLHQRCKTLKVWRATLAFQDCLYGQTVQIMLQTWKWSQPNIPSEMYLLKSNGDNWFICIMGQQKNPHSPPPGGQNKSSGSWVMLSFSLKMDPCFIFPLIAVESWMKIEKIFFQMPSYHTFVDLATMDSEWIQWILELSILCTVDCWIKPKVDLLEKKGGIRLLKFQQLDYTDFRCNFV